MTFSSKEYLEMLVNKMKEEQGINKNEEPKVKEAFELDNENLDEMVKWNQMSKQEKCDKFIKIANKRLKKWKLTL